MVRRLSTELSRDPEFVKRFGNAVRLAATLEHEHLVGLLDVGRVNGRVFVASERVDGRSLGAVLTCLSQHHERMPLAFVAWLGVQVCRGLHDAHTRTDAEGQSVGMVHGALSPTSVLVTFDGQAKVDGVGVALARWVQPTRLGLSEVEAIAYMAPELLEGGAPDRRADVFGVGRVLWEALAGRRAIVSTDVDEVRQIVRHVDFPPLASVAPGLPRAVVEVVERALSVDPAMRYPTAKAMGKALKRAALEGVGDATLREALGSWMVDLFDAEHASREAALEEAQQATFARRRLQVEQAIDERVQVIRTARNRGTWAVAGVGAVAAFGLGAWLLSQSPVEPTFNSVAHGGLMISIAPGGKVMVDGRIQGQGEELVVANVNPGVRVVRAEADAYVTQEQRVRVFAGGTTHVAFRLDEIPKIAPATLTLDSRPTRATVRVNGVVVGRTPTRWTTTDPTGAARIEFSRDGFQEQSERVTLRPGLRRTVSVTLSPK